MSEKYPLGYCLNPVFVSYKTSKGTTTKRVACGSCAACRQKKSYSNKLKCDIESQYSKYCYFVTLTYSDDYLPKYKFCYHPTRANQVVLMLHTSRLEKSHKKKHGGLHRFLYDIDNSLSLHSVRCSLPERDTFSFLYKPDLQNFLKRLRSHVKYGLSSSGKIRYYAVGEYGPKHLRPHFHLLLFFNDESIRENIYRYINKSWKFGFTDCQAVESDASSYVTSYVNSFGTIPPILQTNEFRQFCLHSQGFGEQVFKEEIKTVYENSFDTFISGVCLPSLSDKPIIPYQSVKSYFFPKCRGFSYLSDDECLYRYTFYERLVKLYPLLDFSVSDYAKLLYDLMNSPYNDELVSFLHSEFDYSFSHKNTPFVTYEDYKKSCICQIYLFLRTSYHFVYDICNSDPNLYRSRFLRIKDFYSYLDMLSLNSNYSNMEMFSYSNDFDLELFYDDIVDSSNYYEYICEDVDFDTSLFLYKSHSFKGSYFYNNLKSKVDEQNSRMMKHKYLNDSNQIFFESNLKLRESINDNI